MRVLLLTNDPAMGERVKACLGPKTDLEVRPTAGVVDTSGHLSDPGRNVIEGLGGEDVLLLQWVFDEAPSLNAITHRIRERRAGPSVILCTRPEHAEALAAGADAVLDLPFEESHLEALVLAHKRVVAVTDVSVRAELGDSAYAKPAIELGPVRLDRTGLVVSVDERSSRITPREAGLLGYLMKRAGQVCTREELLGNVWGIQFDTGTNMVDVYVFFVRRKLEALGYEGKIKTVRGAGYRMELPGGSD